MPRFSQMDFAQQAKMAAIGTLSTGISHELKNPLQIVKGMLEMLRMNKKRGFLESYTREELEALVFDVVGKGVEAVDRAVAYSYA